MTTCKFLSRLLVNFWIIIVVLQKKKKTTYMVLKMIKERTWDYSDVVLFMLNISLSLSLIYLTRLAVKLMEEFKITVT